MNYTSGAYFHLGTARHEPLLNMAPLSRRPFHDAVRAGTASIMCSYNRVNNSAGCQNSKTLNGLLKGELGFQGFVVSDWTAQTAGVASALAGLDVAMPDSVVWGDNLTLAISNGTVNETRLDDMVTRCVSVRCNHTGGIR